MNKFSILGVVLILLSAYPLFLMGRELVWEKSVEQNFNVDQISTNFIELEKVEILGKGAPIPLNQITVKNYIQTGSAYLPLRSLGDYSRIVEQSTLDTLRYRRDYSWRGNTIRVEDQFHPGKYNEDSSQESKLWITINQKDWTFRGPMIKIRPSHLDNNRYHGYFGILLVKNKGKEELALVQRISGLDYSNERDLAWRILRMGENGQVKEDLFTYDERGKVPYRVNFVNHAMTSPISLGYKSNILQGWPTVFFPVLYPFVTVILGLVFLVTGLLGRKRQILS